MSKLDHLYTWYLRKRGFAIGAGSVVSRLAKLKGKVSLGENTVISPYAMVIAHRGSISIGKNTTILPYAMVLSQRGSISIGDDCSVNPFCVLYGHGGLTIGNGVRIAAHTVIVPANHGIDAARPIFQQPQTKLGITIEDDVWIGTGARILDGVCLGRGSVIGAGAVVTKSTDPGGIYVGVPAKKSGSRPNEGVAS